MVAVAYPPKSFGLVADPTIEMGFLDFEIGNTAPSSTCLVHFSCCNFANSRHTMSGRMTDISRP